MKLYVKFCLMDLTERKSKVHTVNKIMTKKITLVSIKSIMFEPFLGLRVQHQQFYVIDCCRTNDNHMQMHNLLRKLASFIGQNFWSEVQP